jgi:serine phosphatase RsbU (regulator of sigma subunit)
MVLYSDGLVEATNVAGEEFGESRLEAVVSQWLGETPEKIRESIVMSVRAFLKGQPAHDDLTCVVAKFRAVQSRLPSQQPRDSEDGTQSG